jgi:hypothetical protein
MIADQGQAQGPGPIGGQLDHAREQGERRAPARAIVELEGVDPHRRVGGQGHRGPHQLDQIVVEAQGPRQGQHRSRRIVGQRRQRGLDLGQLPLEALADVELRRGLAPDHGAHRPQVGAVEMEVVLAPRDRRRHSGIHRSIRLAGSPFSAPLHHL